MLKRFGFLFFGVALILPATPVNAQSASDGNISVVFNEIRLGGKDLDTDATVELKEFATLFNAGGSAVSIDGWVIEYAKPGFDSQKCGSASWDANDNGNFVSSTVLSGTLDAESLSSPIIRQFTDGSGGSVRLVQYYEDAQNVEQALVHDLVGWGDDAPCFETAPAAKPATNSTSNNSLFRYTECDDEPIDSDDNSRDFTVADSNPNILGPNNLACGEAGSAASCDGVEITEILPNPASFDTGKEFIEIHNPTEDVIELGGCAISISGKTFTFPNGASLEAGNYIAYYDDETGLTLPNTSGGELILASATTDYPFYYPGGLGDDISWALIDGTWQETDNLTPGAVNEPATPEEQTQGAVSVLKPCPDGKYRNPATNRCKSLENGDGLVACKAGQYRNPETNRCRSLTSAGSSLTPCKPGQERNPATNRCRKVESAKSLQPCGEGEERNPDTNRCRKAAANLASAGVDDKRNGGRKVINYGILGLVGTSAIGYGLYEYRNDFRNKLLGLKTRFLPNKLGK